MEPIIKVENLGKKYNIKHRQGGYITLRDILTNIAKNPLRFLKNKTKKIIGMEKNEEFWALQNINFEVEAGEVIGIIGHNGAGKSTLLKILSEITPPTTGEIKINGTIGSLLEVGTGFHPELSGRENIMLNGAILGMKQKEIAKKFDEIVEFSGIGKFLDTPVKYYSSGMYVRLAFSVAAHMEPDILIIDEVLAVGDAEFQKKCLGKMGEITEQEGRTILFVSHSMDAIKKMCNKCILLENGNINAIGDTNEVIGMYLKNNANLSNSVEINKHKRGNGYATIKKITLQRSDENNPGPVLINETLKFIIDYEIKNKSKKYSFWLIISKEQVPIISFFQKDKKELIESEKENNKIKITLRDLGLLPGEYSVSAGIFFHDGDIRYDFADWVDSPFSFEISKTFSNGDLYDSRLGIITKSAEWENK